MKKFLLYIVIAIAVVSLGLTIYYFSTDNETIYIKSSYLVINKTDRLYIRDDNNDLVDFKNRSEYTTLSYSSQDENVLSYNENEFYFIANVGGETKITITTNNRQYSKFVIDVLVCDGSEQYPYIIKTEEELNNIKTNEETLSYCYKLGNDIELTENWTPIASYGKTFDGNYFSIKNMVITNGVNQGAITNAGFVSVLESTGVIKNLILENININCSVNYIGAFAGTSRGLIQTSEATGSLKNNLTNGTIYVGGIAGQTASSGGKAIIDRCGFEGDIEGLGSTQIIGGVTGLSQGATISESYCRGFIKNNNNSFGGIVGLNQNTEEFSANVYDSYFYLTDKNVSTTNLLKMKGVVYSNTDSGNSNEIMGNYFGGKIAKNAIALTPEGDNFKYASNGYLTSILSEDSTVEFVDKTKFITAKYSDPERETRYWDFDSVWEMTNNGNYPILNIYSSVGSSYLIDISSIITGNHITTAQQLYDVLSNSTTTDTYMIANDISLDPNATDGFVWGDSESGHPLPTESFKGTIINGTTIDSKTGLTRPCEIKNITIKNETVGDNVGLVKKLSSSAKISGLVIKNVTITGVRGNNVGVLAGLSLGAHVYNVEIEQVVVNISGTAFGTLFGRAEHYDGHGIDNVSIKYVNASESYFVHAGGIVGINFATITTETSTYNAVYTVNFVANYVGGVAGSNGGKIYKCNAQKVVFNVKQSAKSITTVYNGIYSVFIGGIVGMNQVIIKDKSTLKEEFYQGSISNVYANATVDAETALNYDLYIGGIAGHNSNYIVRAYVNNLQVNVTGSHSVFAGGLVGYNCGRISNSVVDKESSIVTSISSSISATENYVLNTDNCSIVGGLVGCDLQTTNSTYSLYECATYIKQLQGYYAGGLTGLSFGKVELCYCGESTKENGGVSISGHMVGGLSAVIAGGFVKDSYTFCSLNTGSMSGTYKDLNSALNMDVRCMGGLAVFVFNKATQVSGCYAVVSFSGNGVSYGSCADGYIGGSVSNCVYEKSGSIKTSIGTQISASNLKGADGYKAFKKAIGSTLIWNLNDGYPTIVGVNVRLPGDALPVV